MCKLLSFVIPCYRSEKTIEKVIEEIIFIVGQKEEYDYEVIAINDCSPDNVLLVLKELALKNPKIKVIDFVKNVGKHSAVLAGYAIAKGAYIVNLDDDFQCPIYELWNLLDLVEQDVCDCATAEYYKKKESLLKIWGSNFNLWLSSIYLDKPMGLRIENFSVIKSFVGKEVVKYKNPYPYLEGLIFRVTNRIKTVKMEQRDRGDNNTSGFTFKKSVSLVLNGFTAFSVKPLRMASACGIVFAIIGFLYGIYTIIHKLINPNILLGYSSLLSVFLFSSGLIMLMLGIIGEYLGRIYICINNSPQYVIREMINIDTGENE